MQNVGIASNLIFIVVGLIGGCLFLSNVSDKDANLWMPVHSRANSFAGLQPYLVIGHIL